MRVGVDECTVMTAMRDKAAVSFYQDLATMGLKQTLVNDGYRGQGYCLVSNDPSKGIYDSMLFTRLEYKFHSQTYVLLLSSKQTTIIFKNVRRP